MSYLEQPEPAVGTRSIPVEVPQNADFTLLGGFATEHLWRVPTAHGAVCVVARYLPSTPTPAPVCARAWVAAKLTEALK